jgi:large subunit ribosomal protein L24
MAGRSKAPVKRVTIKLRIHSDDQVEVIAGKDRGKRGRVLRVEPANQRVYVEGLNMVKRHTRPRQVRDASRAEAVGGVIEREGPIHVSNVMLIDPKVDKPTRIGIVHEDGKRFRVAKRTGTRLD